MNEKNQINQFFLNVVLLWLGVFLVYYGSLLGPTGLTLTSIEQDEQEHTTKLISLNAFHIKNISWKFHKSLMNQIRDILKRENFGTK